MTLDIVIPTINRHEKLTKCLESINKAKGEYQVNVFVYYSDIKHEFYSELSSKYSFVRVIETKDYKAPEFWNSHLKEMKSDCMMYLNDDTEMFEDTIKNTIDIMDCVGSDFDAVLGINQVNLPDGQKLKSAFGVIGTKFADRFPQRQVFCPDYHRFYIDAELLEYSEEIQKFYYCPSIRINHYHGSFYAGLIDDTHKEVRKYSSTDKRTASMRRAQGYLWGKNFGLINKK